MKTTTKLFLRLAIAAGFLSAVADRFGMWGSQCYWCNWNNFVKNTRELNPWIPSQFIPALATVVTTLEVLFALFLIVGFRTSLFAKLSGVLLLLFALAMTYNLGIKTPLDFSVYVAAGAAFALSTMKEKYLEIG
jgi:thiosulfate dehydrogenase [quinone] large subunit